MIDPITMRLQLCDSNGMVSAEKIYQHPRNWRYLDLHNHLRSMTGQMPNHEEFACTGTAHLAGEHILCTSSAHKERLDAENPPRLG